MSVLSLLIFQNAPEKISVKPSCLTVLKINIGTGKYLTEIASWADCAHLPLTTLRLLPEWDLITSYTVIAVVRNPYDRFISACKEHLDQHKSQTYEVLLNNIDEIRINYDPRYIHFMPQNRFTHIGNKRYADFIARSEYLKDDLTSISIKANLGESFVRSIDRIKPYNTETSKTNNIYFYPYNSAIIKKIIRFYFRDFILYGYNFPDIDITSTENEELFDLLITAPESRAEWNTNIGQPAYYKFEKRNKLILERDQAVQSRNIVMAEMNAILCSLSWKITNPLRWMKRMIT
ncbi:MAG: sulfotransferase family 2 domain-containing protein [Acidithiobacillus ferrivorans]